MRDADRRYFEPSNVSQNLLLGFDVEMTGRLIEKQDTGPAINRPRQGKALNLAARKIRPGIAKHGLRAHRHALHIHPYLRHECCLTHSFEVDIRIEGGNVVGDRPLEHMFVLHDHTDLPGKGDMVPERKLQTVQTDSAVTWLQLTGKNPEQGSFSTAGGPGNYHVRPRVDLETQLSEQRMVFGVPELEPGNLDSTADSSAYGAAACRWQGFTGYQFGESAGMNSQ